MTTTIAIDVIIAHLNDKVKSNHYDASDEALIHLTVDCYRKGLNPASILSIEGLARFQELTSLNLFKLKVEGIPDPQPKEEPKITSFDQILANILKPNPSYNSDEVTSCVNFSMALNTSSNYAYANNVDDPTCSHPNPPNGTYCQYGLLQSRCPLFTPDVKEETFLVDNHTYKIIYQRTIQATMVIYIYDDVNLVNKLSYFVDQYNALTSDQVKDEISSIIREHHSNMFISSLESQSYNFINSKEEQLPVNSYISSLVS